MMMMKYFFVVFSEEACLIYQERLHGVVVHLICQVISDYVFIYSVYSLAFTNDWLNT